MAPRPTQFTVGLPNLIGAAKDIVRMTASRSVAGRRIEALDNWGCDIPDWLGGRTIECSHLGNCCDTHDACYARFGCGSWSWLTGAATPQCLMCNTFVIACITENVGSTWLPSECCALGNCGEPRATGGGGGGGGIKYLDPYDGGSGGSGGAGWNDIPGGGIGYSGTCCIWDPDLDDYVCLPCG